VRREKKEEEQYENIPLGEKERKQWLKSRKADVHLDNDFMPRDMIYDYGDDHNNKKMEDQIRKINENLRKREERKDKMQENDNKNINGILLSN